MMALELGRSSRVHDTVAYKRVAFGVKLRLYPHGFTDDEFKPGPSSKRTGGSKPRWASRSASSSKRSDLRRVLRYLVEFD